MKKIQDFYSDVLAKVPIAQKQLNKKRLITTLIIVAVLVFLTLFSNIIPFGKMFPDNTYLKYPHCYTSSSGQASFMFNGAYDATVRVGEKTYFCEAAKLSDNTFKLQPNVIEKKTCELTIDFSNDQKPVIKGSISGNRINLTLEAKQEQPLPQGVWEHFKLYQAPNVVEGYSYKWLYFGEKESFAGSTSVLNLKAKMYDNVIYYTETEPKSGISTSSTFIYEESGEFEFPVIKRIQYLNDQADEYYVDYFKLVQESEKINFTGGTFDNKLVKTVRQNGGIPETKTLQNLADWRLFPTLGRVDNFLDNARIQIDLKTDGSLTFSLNSQQKHQSNGKWIKLSDRVLVILDQAIEGYNVKAFTIDDSEGTGDLLSDGTIAFTYFDLYKVGYHAFLYFADRIDVLVYLGSNWTKESFNDTLKLNVVYEMKISVQHMLKLDESGASKVVETLPLVDDNYKTQIIFRENETCEIYQNGVLKKTIMYKDYTFDKKVWFIDEIEAKLDTLRYFIEEFKFEGNKLIVYKGAYFTKEGVEYYKYIRIYLMPTTATTVS